MKGLQVVLLILVTLNITAQQTNIAKKNKPVYYLVAENSGKKRIYYEEKRLKIFYKSGDSILKATGKLHIDSSDEIKLIKYHKRVIVNINPRNIISIRGWSKNNFILASAFAGAGSLLVLQAINNYNKSSIGQAFQTGIIIIGAFTVVEANIIAIIAKEWLDVRSIRKGYEFYVTKAAD